MDEFLLKIIAGTIATLGFAIIFKLKVQLWPFATICGLAACLLYLGLTELIGGDFIPNAVAAFVVALLSEIFARLGKAPATVFLLPGCIALVPGGTLYYTMNNLISENYALASKSFLTTLTIGVGIGGGIIAASLVRMFVSTVINKFKSK
jgi:uncharacterized membrane protein YjjB (DUF3815 family)